MSLAPGTKFGPYEIVAPLGAGGMGEVYRARDTRLGRDVALKLLPDPANRDRFELEAKAVAALNHPNIMAVFDVGDNYFVSELVDGDSLRKLDPMPLRKATEIAAQIADGLAAAHAAGIVHRDLKPENIMVTRQGRSAAIERSRRDPGHQQNRSRRRHGNRRLHVAGAGARAPGRSSLRYFQLRAGAVRNARRQAGVSGGFGRRNDERDPHPGSAGSAADRSPGFAADR